MTNPQNISGHDSEIEASRRALLKHYSSQTMTHGGYVITIFIGFLTLISKLDFFVASLGGRVAFYLLICVLIGFGYYLVGRTIYWGAMAHQILVVSPKQDTKNRYTLIFRLQSSAYDGVRNIEKKDPSYRWYQVARHFNRFRAGRIFIVSVLFFLMTLIVEVLVF